MRLNRGTILLLGVSLLVVVVAVFFQQPLQSLLTQPTPTIPVRQLLPFDIAQTARQLSIYENDNVTEIDRIDDKWQITTATIEEENRETNHDFVVGILRLMAGIEYSRSFSADDLAQYGLAESPTRIEIMTADTSYRLQLGATNPDGDQLYIRLNDENDVYLVPAVFEFFNIMRLATEPPYSDVAVIDENVPDNLLFPDVFGYQITTFSIRDMRDGSRITYTQGDRGTWIIEGTVVNEDIEIDHVQAAVNVSQFLFLDVEPLDETVRESLTNVAILTLSMTTEDSQSYTMTVYTVEDIGYAGILNDGAEQIAYALPIDTVNLFFDMVTNPPYITSS